jgi:hypothetical protein
LSSLFLRSSKLAGESPAQGVRAKRVIGLGVVFFILLLVYLILSNWRVNSGLAGFVDRPYFPEDAGIGRRGGYASPVLESMGEPSLWKLSQRGRDAAYRFLCVPSMIGRPFAVRITRAADGAELRIIELDKEIEG